MDIYLAGSNGRRDLIELAIKGNIYGYILGRRERQKPHSDCIYRGGGTTFIMSLPSKL